MDLGSYVSNIRHELALAADAGGEDARVLAERLAAPLESALRLALLDALSDAADEITRDLAPGSVHLRLRGREPAFVVTQPPSESLDEAGAPAGELPPVAPEDDDGAMARVNFRLTENLKGRIEEAAERAGLSVNGWLVRASAAALDADGGGRGDRRAARGSQRLTGWVR
jgi:hypothetical protein